METDTPKKDPKVDSEPPAVSDKGGNLAAKGRRLFHAGSGAAILGIDWLLFSGNIATGGMATLPTMAVGFALGGLSTGLIQHFVAGDSVAKSAAKALAAGLLVGMPTPVAGTALGGAILALSGLSKPSVNDKP